MRYSEAFKRQVVRELAEGKYPSMDKARRAYRIGGQNTVQRWVRAYGTAEQQPRMMRIQTMKERDELKEARMRIRELEAALSDAHVDQVLGEAYLKLACERAGEDAESFKKKHGLTLSGLRGNRNRDRGLR
jgi:transposase-like protein